MDALDPKNQSNPDRQAYEEPPGRSAATWPFHLESTGRHLGIDVDDALEISEQTEIEPPSCGPQLKTCGRFLASCRRSAVGHETTFMPTVSTAAFSAEADNQIRAVSVGNELLSSPTGASSSLRSRI